MKPEEINEVKIFALKCAIIFILIFSISQACTLDIEIFHRTKVKRSSYNYITKETNYSFESPTLFEIEHSYSKKQIEGK